PDLFLDRSGLPLGRGDHDLLARAHHLARAFDRALFAVVLDALQIIHPFVLAAHRMEPVAPVADAEIADGAFDALVDRRHVGRVAAAGPPEAVVRVAFRVDIFARLHVADRVADALDLPLRHDPAALVALARAPAAVVEAEAGVARGAELLEHHRVMLRVLEAQKAG